MEPIQTVQQLESHLKAQSENLPKLQHLIVINPPLIAINPQVREENNTEGSRSRSLIDRDQLEVREEIFTEGSRSRPLMIAINLNPEQNLFETFMLIAITKNMIAINIAENPETQILKLRKQHQRPQKPRLSPEINILTLY